MYDSLARYYDLIHSSLTVDLAFLLDLAKEAAGPILELGCGTGRLLIPLVRSGCAVTGVDKSPAMLAKASALLKEEPWHVQQRAALVEADMRSLSLPQTDSSFSLILLPYNTLLHFRTTEIQRLLRNSSRFLAYEGRLFIDVINPFVVEGARHDPEPTLENTYYDQETGETIQQMSQSRLDSADQCLHTTWIFESKSKAEPSPTRTTINFDYWYQYPHQLELILQQSGYRLEHMMGDYDGASFDHNSSRLLIIARRASE